MNESITLQFKVAVELMLLAIYLLGRMRTICGCCRSGRAVERPLGHFLQCDKRSVGHPGVAGAGAESYLPLSCSTLYFRARVKIHTIVFNRPATNTTFDAA